jgi:Acetyltransferases, including N-acetylases of ribosomal proteins
MTFVMGGDILLETPRLRLRTWRESDAEALYKYASDPEVGPRAGWPPHRDVRESRDVIRKIFSNGRTWALELKDCGEPVGCICYYGPDDSNIGIGEDDAELGYWIARPCWNQGLCTEALRAMIDWCFNERGIQTLWADFFVDNPASGRVLEKCGFRDTGEVNWLSHLYKGDGRPVKVMRLDYAL